MIVHFMQFGMTPHPVIGSNVRTPPIEWPNGHQWSGHWPDVNCQACLEAARSENANTYTIAPDNGSMTCLICHYTTHRRSDIKNHYCSHCHVSHDDIWPPARKWMIEHWNVTL